MLIMQVLKDSQRKGMHQATFAHMKAMARPHQRLSQTLTDLEKRYSAALELGDAEASLKMRSLVSELGFAIWACAMVADGTDAPVIEHLIDRRLGSGAERNAAYVQRIQQLAQQP